jgi:hypothetical protein
VNAPAFLGQSRDGALTTGGVKRGGMAGKFPLWSEQQIATLRAGYAAGVGAKSLAECLNRSPGAVRNKAYDLQITAKNDWTDEQTEELRQIYAAASYVEDLDLAGIAERFGKTKAAVALRASRMGFANNRRPTRDGRADRRKFKGDDAALRADMSERAKRQIAENGHPKGMAGKRHTPEVRERLSETSKAAWSNKSEAERQEWRDNLYAAQQTSRDAPPKLARGTWKAGWREIGGKRNYYRSRWEANYARYLDWLKQNGQISDWQHEPETFWFEAIKRGVRSYKPDFRVWEVSGQSTLHEVKGWMDARSKTTLKRMAKYYPAETVIVVREKQYNEIARKVGPMIEGWESGGRADRP